MSSRGFFLLTAGQYPGKKYFEQEFFMSILFNPAKIGNMEIRNRFINSATGEDKRP